MGRQVYYYGGTPKTLTREQTAAILYQAGFRGQDLVNFTAIAGRESGYKYNVHGSDAPQEKVSGDRGLFQINYVNDQMLMDAGIIKQKTDLFDPLTNAKAAKFLFDRSGYFPWRVGPGGWSASGDPLYGTNVSAASEAVTSAANKGLFGSGITLASLGISPIGTGIPLPGVPSGGEILDKIPGVGAITDAVGWYRELALRVLSVDWWFRVLKVVGGSVFLLIGLVTLTGRQALNATPVGRVANAAASI